MVPRLTALPYREVSRWLVAHGFRPLRQRGSHVVLGHADGRIAVLPRHDDRDIPVGTLKAIARQLNLDVDELRR